jgi:hypothetical protein
VTSSSSRRAVSRAHSGSRWRCSHPGDVKGPENRRWLPAGGFRLTRRTGVRPPGSISRRPTGSIGER